MGKFNLQQRTGASPLKNTQTNGNDSSNLGSNFNLADYGKEGLELVRLIISGKRDIAVIQANTEQQLQLIDGEIKKLFAVTENKLKLMQEEGRQWHDKFDKKRQAIMELCTLLDSHPEYTDDIKAALIRLFEKSLES